MSEAAQVLMAEARERGFLAAWSPLELGAEAQRRYRDWLAEGKQAGMEYLGKNVEARLSPKSFFAWANSALVLAAPHAYPDPGAPAGGTRLGRVARYAWVRDYHALVRPHLQALEALADGLGIQAKGYVDHGPLSERGYAVQAGLGWVGRNAMLMRMGEGTYLTLAVVLTDLLLPPAFPYLPAHPNRCGTCARCVTGCPTGALAGDGTLDSRRCVSYWTVEHRGLIPAEMWAGVGDWLLGCDVCQEVCPWNRKAEAFWAGFAPEPGLAHPDLEDFFALSSYAFARKYAATAFLRPGRTRMARNALVVLANRGDRGLLPLVRRAAGDVNPVVRATAARALVVLGDPDAAVALKHDPDPLVAQEALSALTGGVTHPAP